MDSVFLALSVFPQWGTAETKIEILSVENPELSMVLFFKPVVGQYIALHVSSAARIATFLVSVFRVHFTSFRPILVSPFLLASGHHAISVWASGRNLATLLIVASRLMQVFLERERTESKGMAASAWDL